MPDSVWRECDWAQDVPQDEDGPARRLCRHPLSATLKQPFVGAVVSPERCAGCPEPELVDAAEASEEMGRIFGNWWNVIVRESGWNDDAAARLKGVWIGQPMAKIQAALALLPRGEDDACDHKWETESSGGQDTHFCTKCGVKERASWPVNTKGDGGDDAD